MRAQRKPPTTPPGGGPVGRFSTTFLLLFMIALAASSLYAIVAFWPSEPGQGRAALPTSKEVEFFWYQGRASRETLFFIIVTFSGALGGMLHGLRSVGDYIGERALRWSWVPFYLLKPVVGAVLAMLLYFVLRAGLFSPSASTQQASPYGFAAISALAGAFSTEAIVKLKRVAEELFETVPPGTESVATLPDATTGAARVTSPTEATVTGNVSARGLETTVHFDYGETTEYGRKTPFVTLPPNHEGDTRASLAGLTPNTTYHYRLVATSAAGTRYGAEQLFKTPPAN